MFCILFYYSKEIISLKKERIFINILNERGQVEINKAKLVVQDYIVNKKILITLKKYSLILRLESIIL